MDANHKRIFGLYYSGHPTEEIGRIICKSQTYVIQILHRFGSEWVKDHLKQEYKQIIIEGVEAQYTSDEIAKLLGWNRWVVKFTIQHMDSVLIIEKDKTETIPIHTFRCPLCSSPFQSTLAELNPDRICPLCVDRRQGDRRESKRVD